LPIQLANAKLTCQKHKKIYKNIKKFIKKRS